MKQKTSSAACACPVRRGGGGNRIPMASHIYCNEIEAPQVRGGKLVCGAQNKLAPIEVCKNERITMKYMLRDIYGV